jgi:hypothetical protein
LARWDFHNYQGQNYEETTSGHQGGRMSFSGGGYHDFHENQHRIDGRLTTIEEMNAAIQSTLHQHSQWQATMGRTIAKFNNNSNSRTRTGTFCSGTSTSGHHIERLRQQPAWGKGIPRVSKISISFPCVVLFLSFALYVC